MHDVPTAKSPRESGSRSCGGSRASSSIRSIEGEVLRSSPCVLRSIRSGTKEEESWKRTLWLHRRWQPCPSGVGLGRRGCSQGRLPRRRTPRDKRRSHAENDCTSTRKETLIADLQYSASRAGRSAGRSLSWHGRGRGFKSHPVHFSSRGSDWDARARFGGS